MQVGLIIRVTSLTKLVIFGGVAQRMTRLYHMRPAISSAYLFTRKSQTVDDISCCVFGPVSIVRGPAMTFVAIALVVTPPVGCLVDILVSRSVVCRSDYSDGMLVARFDRK